MGFANATFLVALWHFDKANKIFKIIILLCRMAITYISVSSVIKIIYHIEHDVIISVSIEPDKRYNSQIPIYVLFSFHFNAQTKKQLHERKAIFCSQKQAIN